MVGYNNRECRHSKNEDNRKSRKIFEGKINTAIVFLVNPQHTLILLYLLSALDQMLESTSESAIAIFFCIGMIILQFYLIIPSKVRIYGECHSENSPGDGLDGCFHCNRRNLMNTLLDLQSNIHMMQNVTCKKNIP